MTVVAAELSASDGPLRAQQRWSIFRQLLRKKIAVVVMVYLALFYGIAILAPVLAPSDPNRQELTVEARKQGPSSDHLLGTDSLGRDLLSRVMYAARTTILFTAVAVLSGTLLLGLGLGMLAGYRGGWVDATIIRVGEILSSLPSLVLILGISASLRPRINDISFWLQDHTVLGADAKVIVKFSILVLATAPFSWYGSARVVRSQVLAIREATYVAAAEALGASTPRILFRHVLPGVIPLFLVGLSSGMAGYATLELALSYIGLGLDPPTSSFGTLINDAGGIRTFQQTPHLLLAGALPVVFFIYAWNLLGDALVDIFERRTSRT
jgi:ABC-type dipeptide/oligopeptide/nickel transport system permease subunit